jgi:hypothetical protein
MIHWLSNSRVSLQRLGFCKIAVAICDGPRSRQELSEAARRIIQRPVTVDAESEIGHWIRSRPKGSANESGEGTVRVTAQDQWIFQHPSRSGWLPELAHEEYFEKMGLPIMLGLLDEDCRRTDWGQLLLELSQDERDEVRFERGNPLILTKGDTLLFLAAVIRCDGDFLIPYLNDLLRFGDGSFSYLEAGERVPDVMDEVLRRFRSAVYTGDDRERYQDLQSAQAKIRENINRRAESMGSGSRREQTVLPRLEWLVDLGILCKKGQTTRSYSLSAKGRAFAERLYREYTVLSEEGFPEEAVARLLDRRFFQLAYPLLYDQTEVEPPNDVISFLSVAYPKLKSPTGYCVGRTLLLFSHVISWEARQAVALEYDSARERLEQAYQKDPTRFYYTTARFGEDFQIRIEA